jgi:hypothetical protein
MAFAFTERTVRYLSNSISGLAVIRPERVHLHRHLHMATRAISY